ncbi:hypothetical protein KDL01_30610 [Actinospica durhamensis]|uniref:Uncharacterized protein n=1 Tax=Actinospica durhamensis TaxID=1508375 RepID=A0A941EU29_9ACTN|nr:hypothetical protein [Actinospica durhamensis]MBR7837670.1 hypothetical protein [Actinospica durhamensis]
MTSKSNGPSAHADIDELQAWAARANKAAVGSAGTTPSTPTASAGSTPGAAPSAFSSVPTPSYGQAVSERRGSGLRGGSMLPKILLVAGAGIAVYLVFSFILSLLMTLLMIVGGVALLYGVYKVGRWRGRRD